LRTAGSAIRTVCNTAEEVYKSLCGLSSGVI